MISHNKKFIFVHIPKCGGTSIQELLLPYFECEYEHNNVGLIKFRDDNGTKKHSTMLKMAKVIGRRKLRHYFRFTLVRNPYDRFVSMYFWAVKYRYQISKKIQALLLKEDKINISYANILIKMDMARTQTRWLQICGKIHMDYIIHLENIQEDWNKVCRVLHFPKSIVPKLNTNKHREYTYYLYPELKELIKKVYKVDFENFKYAE